MRKLATLTIDPTAANPLKLDMPAGTLGALEELYRAFVNSPVPQPILFTILGSEGADTWTIPLGVPVHFRTPFGAITEKENARFYRQKQQLQERADVGASITFDNAWELLDHKDLG